MMGWTKYTNPKVLIAVPILPMSVNPTDAKPLFGTAGKPALMDMTIIQICIQTYIIRGRDNYSYTNLKTGLQCVHG